MIQTYDLFNTADPPAIFLCNPNREILASVTRVIYETKLTLRFNALSEFSFVIPKSIDNNITTLAAYDKIKVKRQIYIENIGYFIINSAVENSDGSVPLMTVECQSLEAEMLSKKVNVLTGTCRLYNVANPTSASPTDSLLGYLLSLINAEVPPSGVGTLGWTITGVIDGTLAAKYRTFDVSDSTVYGLLMNDIEKAYECIFLFDTINRTISVKTLASAVTGTNIFISYDNLAQETELSEMSDEICTALYVYGGDGLEIRSVNPTGDNVIYDFSYYMNTNWMSQSLITALTTWNLKIAAQTPQYNIYLTNLYTYYLELGVLETDLATLEGQYAALEILLKGAIEAGSGVSAARTNLNNKQAKINIKNAAITSKNGQIANTTAQVVAVNNDLKMTSSSNFTIPQRIELSKYIMQNTYQNENIIITDSFTPAQIQTTKTELYNQAKTVLAKVAIPRYEFSMNSVNFINLKEFSGFTSQIPVYLGAQITIATTDYPIISVLLELELSYDSPEDFSLTFSNRLRLDNGKFQYSDLAGQTVKTGASVSFNVPKWSNWTTDYKDEVTNFITSALDATKNEVINASNQEIVINGAGLRGRKSTGTNTYEANQVWLTSNTLAFTDDDWVSAKTAVGRISFGGGVYGYGIAGQYIIGNIIAGNELTISNANNSFILNGTGATLTNAKLTVQSQLGGAGGIIIDPNQTSVVKMGSITGGLIPNPTFSVDQSGNVTMTGNLYAGSNYIKTDGTAKIGGLTITGTTATFTGDIYANKLIGTVDWSQIVNAPLPANRLNGTVSGYSATGFTSGTMNNVAMRWGNGSYISTGGLENVYIYGASTGTYLSVGDGATSTVNTNGVIGCVGLRSSGGVYSYNTLVATENWVNGRGFITSLAGYATQSWVGTYYAPKFNGISGHMYVGPSYSNKDLTFTNGVLTFWEVI